MNKHIILTNEQINSILEEDIFDVTFAFTLTFDHFLTLRPLTDEQIELGLTSKHPAIREKFAHKDIPLTDEQIKRGLNDDYELTVAAFISRDDSLRFLDTDRVDKILTGDSDIIKLRVAEHEGIKFTQKQVELGLIDDWQDIREIFSQMTSVGLSRKQINRGLNDEDEYVRAEFVKRIDFKPNDAQIDYIIMNDTDIFIITLLGRDDITLKCGHINLLLKNKNPLIWQNVKMRKEYIDYQMLKETLKPKTKNQKINL